jgi:hypothetical protein
MLFFLVNKENKTHHAHNFAHQRKKTLQFDVAKFKNYSTKIILMEIEAKWNASFCSRELENYK